MSGEHLYRVIVKIGNKLSGEAHTLKYRTSNLLKFTEFLDIKWPEWRWYNVYDKKTGAQVGNFTKFDRPTKDKI